MSAGASPPSGARGARPHDRTGPVAPAALAVEDLACRFGRVQALAGVSLAVRPGEVMALLGDSGCGKSTLLRVVAGLEAPQAGTVRLDGRLVAGPGTRVPPEARGVGLMFQDYALFPHLTVRGEHPLRPQGPAAGGPRGGRRAPGAGRLAAHAGAYPQTLSGGEQQRVALVRALAPGPRLLLLDEPFSNLDRRMRDRVREDTVALLRRTGTTALMVTHDPEEALAVATRIALMRRGRIVQVATGEALYRRPESLFAARFLADAAEIPTRIAGGRAGTPLGAVPASHLPEGARSGSSACGPRPCGSGRRGTACPPRSCAAPSWGRRACAPSRLAGPVPAPARAPARAGPLRPGRRRRGDAGAGFRAGPARRGSRVARKTYAPGRAGLH